ncbi:MAG: sigma factor-like helix-turn-helix DNA-binding protein, partial [Ruthenibacterium sp.]
EDLSDFEKNRCEVRSSANDTYDTLLMEDLKKVLNEREQSVVCLLYFRALTVAETASQLHISRQAVNNIKLSALCKLRQAYNAKEICF